MVKDEQKVTWHDPIWDGMLDSRVVPQKKIINVMEKHLIHPSLAIKTMQ
jgi:hypothetical protein